MKDTYKDQFETKYIRRKNKLRKIVAYKYNGELKAYHSKVNLFLNDNVYPSKFAKAYIKNRSIYHNAYAHMYNDTFILLDIKSFFNNINHNKLVKALYKEINKFKEIISKEECFEIVDDCSINTTGIPLGFVSSPCLANLYLKEFDQILYGKLKRYDLNNVIYTRYSDDITISYKGERENNDEIINLVQSLLKSYSLRLNNNKTRIININKSNHVKITGVNVTKKLDNTRKLTIGRKEKNEFFWRVVDCYNQDIKSKKEVLYIKGMQSYILSIEKQNYENCYSNNMMDVIKGFGYMTLKDLIDNMMYVEKNSIIKMD